MLQVVLSIVMTLGFAASMVLSRGRTRGMMMIAGLGMVLGAYWTFSAWREWRGGGGRRRR